MSIRKLAVAVTGFALAASMAHALVASDDSSNYGGSWNDNDNEGTGFGAWAFNHVQGTGAAGVFIGDPTVAGISGLGTESFGFFANPSGSGANAEVSRSFASALDVGDTFSFLWGVNFDSGSAGSNRGINFFAGTTQININMGNSAAITIDGNPMFDNYGTAAMLLSFEYLNATTLRVFGTGRDGSESFDDTFTVDGAPSGFAMYYNAADNDFTERQMYFDDLQVVPEPGTFALIGLGLAGGFMVYLRRRRA